MGNVQITSTIATVGMEVRRNPDNWPYGVQDYHNGTPGKGKITHVGPDYVNVSWESGRLDNYSLNYNAASTLLLWEESKELEGDYLTSLSSVQVGEELIFGRHHNDSYRSNLSFGDKVKVVSATSGFVQTSKKEGWWVPNQCFMRTPTAKPKADTSSMIKGGDTVEVADPSTDYLINSYLTTRTLYKVVDRYPLDNPTHIKLYVPGSEIASTYWYRIEGFTKSSALQEIRDGLKELVKGKPVAYIQPSIHKPTKTKTNDRSSVISERKHCGTAFKVYPKITRLRFQEKSGGR